MPRIAAAAIAALLVACDTASHPTPRDGGVASDGAAPPCDPASFVVCPCSVRPTFTSLRSEIFQASCGTNRPGSCHSVDGALNSGGLDFATDAHAALLGTNGQGATAENIAGSARPLVRVKPGDADHSFLTIKLSTKTATDARYGSGMPFGTSGSICPTALAAIRAWIAAGAAND